MGDPFNAQPISMSAPASDGASVTPNDASDLPTTGRGIMVTAGGNVQVTLASGTVLTLPLTNASYIYQLRVRRVWSTGTTATGIFVFW